MKNLMILTLAITSFNLVLTAQVKEQFRDRDNSSTIVVVKEDNANDQKVLSDYFDLADMSMSDQIMIMTVPEDIKTAQAPNVADSTASTDDNVVDFFEDYDTDEVVIDTKKTNPIDEALVQEKEIAQNVEIINESKPNLATSKKNVASTRAKGNYTIKNSADVKRAAQKKYFKKKKKKKKSKKKLFGKKNSNSCYRF